ncbi:hypothetical protein WJX81_006941 [Elliptochloris bilobata]|uniref:CS domain-containing protein n=1 Tax=Elliptochloris bilobata TaxID=381761 RepID=A0AAW1RD63_9CHLO
MVVFSDMDELELDVGEVERLLGQTSRRIVKGRLLLLLNELNEVKKQRQEQALNSLASLQLGSSSQGLPVLQQGTSPLSPPPPPPPPPPPVQNGYGQYAPQQQQTLVSLATTVNLLAFMKERGMQHPAHVGGPSPSSQPGSNGVDAPGAVPYDSIWDNVHGAAHAPHLSPGLNNSAHANGAPWNSSTALGQYRPKPANGMNGLDVGLPVTNMSPNSAAMTPYSAPMLGNYLGGPPPQLAPFGFGASLVGNGDFTFRTLTTCSWEQSDTMVKVYVPLRGVQTELLRSNFTMTSVEIKVYNLQGKNYVFSVVPTCKQILGEACVAVASKTKKNILITIQKLSSALPDERHWRDLFGVPFKEALEPVAAPLIGYLGHCCCAELLLRIANTSEVRNGAALDAALKRPPDMGLITVCNHTSTLDDPVVLSAMLPLRFFWGEARHGGNRWSLCAKEICFRNELLRQFFASGKVLPVERGAGLAQPAVALAGRLAAAGDWLHLFPEGRVGYTGRLAPCRWGVGKVVCDCVRSGHRAPMVLPFYHSGMGRVLPKHGRVPRAGQRVAVLLGDPVPLDDLAPRCLGPDVALPQVWREIAQRVCEALADLESRSPPNWDQAADGAALSSPPHGAPAQGGVATGDAAGGERGIA